MTKIYCREHIKVWKKNHGKIPKDESGRSIEIHHKDGDPKNNSIENLQCLPIEEHYKIHLQQKDYGAAFLIGRRMKISPEELSEIAKKLSLKKIEDGTHNFLNPNFQKSLYHNRGYVVAIDTRSGEVVRIEKKIFDQNEFYVGVNKDRRHKKVHDNRGHNKGRKWTQKHKEEHKKCQYCEFVGRASHIKRYHNERCKKYNAD